MHLTFATFAMSVVLSLFTNDTMLSVVDYNNFSLILSWSHCIARAWILNWIFRQKNKKSRERKSSKKSLMHLSFVGFGCHCPSIQMLMKIYPLSTHLSINQSRSLFNTKIYSLLIAFEGFRSLSLIFISIFYFSCFFLCSCTFRPNAGPTDRSSKL